MRCKLYTGEKVNTLGFHPSHRRRLLCIHNVYTLFCVENHFSNQLLHNNLKDQWFKIATLIISVSVGHRCCLARSLSSHKFAVIPSLDWEKQLLSSFTWLLAGLSSFLAVLRLQLLLVGQMTPSVACHVCLFTEHYITWQLNLSEKVSGRTRESANRIENASRTKDTVLCNLIMEVTAHHFDLILFIRNKSLGPAYT